jgi:hypothetical protein
MSALKILQEQARIRIPVRVRPEGNPAGKPRVGATYQTSGGSAVRRRGRSADVQGNPTRTMVGKKISARRLSLDRIMPVRRDRPVAFELSEGDPIPNDVPSFRIDGFKQWTGN